LTANTQELHPSFKTFPTYPIILPFKHTDQEVVDFYARSGSTPIPGVPKFDSKRGVDGERKITFLKPLPPTSEGKKFEIRSKVIGVYDKGKAGSVVETQQELVEAGSGEVYSRVRGSGFMVGQGNWGGPKGEFLRFPPAAAVAASSIPAEKKHMAVSVQNAKSPSGYPHQSKPAADQNTQVPKSPPSTPPRTKNQTRHTPYKRPQKPRSSTASTATTTRSTPTRSPASRWASAAASSTASSPGTAPPPASCTSSAGRIRLT